MTVEDAIEAAGDYAEVVREGDHSHNFEVEARGVKGEVVDFAGGIDWADIDLEEAVSELMNDHYRTVIREDLAVG